MVRIAKSSAKPESERPEATIAQTPPTTKPRRGWGKRVAIACLIVACFSGGWFSYKVAAASNRIFATNTSGGSPVLQGKQLPASQQKRINILLIGIGGENHDGANLADTIQVASVDPKTKQIQMLSIPRDLYVKVPDSTGKVKINEVHSIGEDRQKGDGPVLLEKTVSEIIGQPINYYARVDFDGFKQLVDSVGGVTVNVKERLYDPYYPRGESTGYEILNIPAGAQQMNGETALKYARSRETTTDFDRSRRQQEVLAAARDKALSLQYLTNPAKVSQLIDIAGDHVRTDMSLSEIQKLAKIVKDIPSASIQSKVLDNTNVLYDSVGPGGAYILVPKSGNYSEIQAFVDQFFNGAAISSEAAQVELQNATGRGGLAQQEADTLGQSGYSIVAVTNSPSLSQPSIVYDYTDGQKSATADALAKRYNAKVIKQPRATADTVDIRVVIGTSYLNTTSTGSQFQNSQY